MNCCINRQVIFTLRTISNTTIRTQIDHHQVQAIEVRLLETHRVRSQTDETVNIHVNLTLPWVAKSFCWVCHALAHMVKPYEISRQITYEFTNTVAKLLEHLPCIPEVVCSIHCQVIPKNLNMIILQLLFRLAISIEQTEMVGLL